MTPAYLDLRALAEYTSLSVRSWRGILSRPDAPPQIRLSRGKIIVSRQDVDKFMDGLKQQPGALVGELVAGVLKDFNRKN